MKAFKRFLDRFSSYGFEVPLPHHSQNDSYDVWKISGSFKADRWELARERKTFIPMSVFGISYMGIGATQISERPMIFNNHGIVEHVDRLFTKASVVSPNLGAKIRSFKAAARVCGSEHYVAPPTRSFKLTMMERLFLLLKP